MEMGLTDPTELADIINATENEDLRAAINSIIEQLTKSREKWLVLVARFSGLMKARELIAEKQGQAEATLLDRIHELGKETDSPEGLHELAAAYAQLRLTSVAPGWYYPDVRHTDDPKGE
jgi:hypothetical protein